VIKRGGANREKKVGSKSLQKEEKIQQGLLNKVKGNYFGERNMALKVREGSGDKGK